MEIKSPRVDHDLTNDFVDIDVQAELRMKEDVQLEPVTIVTKRKRTHSANPQDTPASGNQDRCIRKSSASKTKRHKHSASLQLQTPESIISEDSSALHSPPCPTLYSPAASDSTPISTPGVHDPYESVPKQSHHQISQTGHTDVPRNTGDSILRLLSGSKIGSTKDTAAFYLSSFLAHIESLGKLPSSLFRTPLFQNCWS